VIKVVYRCSVRSKKPLPKGGPDVLTIKDAAEILGVSEVTLRRWDKAGKFSPHRHPLNGYRCYRREHVLRLRRQIESGKAA
jgi:DNA-binding transcriptional MerR regulator